MLFSLTQAVTRAYLGRVGEGRVHGPPMVTNNGKYCLMAVHVSTGNILLNVTLEIHNLMCLIVLFVRLV